MELTPKQKSDVQFNGYEKFKLEWSIPYASSVNKEFQERYDNIIELYDNLKEEIYWNNLIYNINIQFKPVIGNTYYLYNEDKYILSLISPKEWNKECLGEFKFDHNGKWNKLK